jgi:tRNA A37 methylthiotransferase MiaB
VDPTYTQQAVSADLIPQAVGGIATYTEKMVSLNEPIRVFKYPEKLAQALDEHGCPDVIGFSNYVWNCDLSSAFARRIKELSPKTIVVFGGPNYPIQPVVQEQFLRERPYIDFCINKEGELAFANLIAAIIESNGNLDQVHGTLASVHSIGPDDNAHLTGEVERIRDLSEIPSPYTTGRMDEFFDGKLLPIIQTNRGCPFSCTFCVEGVRYYNKIYLNSQSKMSAEIHHIGKKMEEIRHLGGRNDLFIADSNFGMYKDDIDTCKVIAEAQEKYNWPEYINVATGKNQKERVLAASKLINGALRLSGSVQSLDPEVLENISRANIGADGLMQLALEAADIGANSYSETILCLPGDSKEKHYNTLRQVIEASFNMVSTFQLMMLPGTNMNTEETREKFGMITRFRVFPRCYGFYDVQGERIVSAEIEEICVALNTLTFDDYLDCRKMHLLIAVFHNDGVFGSLLRYLRTNGYSVFRWLEIIHGSQLPLRLDQLIEEFLQDTRDELWGTREELEQFIQQPGTIEKYLDGELGNNLLFTYKTRALIGYVNELAEVAQAATFQVLDERGDADPEAPSFIDDAIAYQVSRMTNVFEDREQVPSASLNYDIQAYDEELKSGPISEYRFSSMVNYEFVQTDEQNSLLERYFEVFGSTDFGIGRMMTKVYVKRLLREPQRRDAA